MSELKAVDCNDNELKVGDTVEVRCLQGSSVMRQKYNVGDRGVITRLHPSAWSAGPDETLVQLAGSYGSQYAKRFELVERAPCCTLQEAADLLEAQGIQVDQKQLKRVLNPRPKTLPISKIRLRDSCGDNYIVTKFKPYHFQAISLVDHVPWNEGSKLSGGASGLCLDALEKSVAARGLTLLDTWSPDTEFPELLDGSPELLES